MKSGFWKSDWFLGLAVVVAVVGVNLFSDAIEGLERKAYDAGVQLSVRPPSDKIAIIAIDDESISNIGRWPWPRDVHATMVDLLAGAKAKVIGSTILLSESEVEKNKGYRYVTKLLDLAAKTAPSDSSSGAPSQSPPGETSKFVALLREAEQELNTDRKLAESYAKAANVLVPLDFTIGEPRGRPDKPLPEYVKKNAIAAIKTGSDLVPPPTSEVRIPIEPIGKAAAGLGSLTQFKDNDGAIRIEPLVLGYFDELYPALSMMVVAKYLNLGPSDIKARLGEGVTLQRLRIRTDGELKMRTFFYKDREGKPAFQVDSFYDVFVKKIPAEKYRDKIVLIGATASGLGDNPATPIAPSMAPVLLLAHSVSSILQEHFFVAPAWGGWIEFLVFVLVALYLTLLLPRLNAGPALAVSVGIFAVLIVAHFSLMMSSGLWIMLMLPASLLLIGHGSLISKRFIATERGKQKSDESSAESNRMLGIAYQAQGQLDLAWDKFRQVPMSHAVLDNLYSLALDFERKRQFNKAESVFRHMHEYNPKFKDLEQRLSRAKQLSETVILGGGSSHPGGSLNLAAGEKPKFGRFEVQKELGKGAMGVVYLGKDPKIGREVAIKTMALAQEFEAEELTEVKERFFREAETAGRLSHPNIVTIYDTGEEHDFCYIAMELLKGGDLAPYVKANSLLAAEKAVSIAARAADALGYAHKQGVVHRDIKPANMMYHAGTDTLKLTDFGIARLTDSSKTRTGMVLGTPSYMSPEQLAGKKIEGRSDLFSLAVSLYQMLCGKLPFEGESMAQLMYKIANEPPTAILSINPGVPPALVAFLDRALAKNPDERYQTGDEFAAALRSAASSAPAAAAPPPLDIEL